MIRTVFWWTALILNGADRGLEPSDTLVPPGWNGNPWGPEATDFRRDGTFPPLPITPELERWDRWGRENLQTGDILFRQANARILFGYFPFSRFIANVNNSRFSHTGVVVVEKGDPFVYDTTKHGVRRQPFAIWTMDIVDAFAVKRLKAEHQDRIPRVVDFLHQAYAEQVPFDFNLRLDDESLYCVEMTEKAFRAAGLRLSEPIMLGDMERAGEFPLCMFGIWYASTWILDEPLDLQRRVFFPGNDRYGIWASPDLVTVFEGTREAQ